MQAFEQELASLPGCYTAPEGCILLLQHQPAPDQPAVAVGCVAVRPLLSNHSAHAAHHALEQKGGITLEQQQPPQQPQQQDPPVAGLPADPSRVCEMKRLFVQHAHKGRGLGRALAAAAVAAARQCGCYSHMVLDTLDTLTAANKLYTGLGFVQRAAYYHNPLPGVVYWELELGQQASQRLL